MKLKMRLNFVRRCGASARCTIRLKNCTDRDAMSSVLMKRPASRPWNAYTQHILRNQGKLNGLSLSISDMGHKH